MSTTTLISAVALGTGAVYPAFYLQPGVAAAVPDAAVADLLAQGATVVQEAAPEEAPKAAPKAAPKVAPKAADGE
jgi:hypothetical protein